MIHKTITFLTWRKKMAKYKQALLETEEGLFAVTVEANVVLNDLGRIMKPQNVIDEGSTIVAVEQGILPAGEYDEEPNPYDIEQAEAGAGGNGGQAKTEHIRSDGPQFGTFMVQYALGGGITLKLMPSLGQFT
jgi:hypothetical protein